MNYPLRLSMYACAFCTLSLFLMSFTPASVVFTSLLKGEKTMEGNKLTWTTSSEVNCSLFMVEKSRDGINYTTLATLPATDSDEAKREYHYFDKQEKGMRVFYRLVNVKNDGSGSFSHEVVLSEKGENAKFFMSEVAASATHESIDIKIISGFKVSKCVQSCIHFDLFFYAGVPSSQTFVISTIISADFSIS